MFFFRTLPLPITQPPQLLAVETEVMADLVQQCDSDLARQRTPGPLHLTDDRAAEEHHPIR